ncbi:hypothetical protein HID58_072956 [Brassica napus]|uniref:Prolamin-like domain-containing protein n=1 Tax=Brassica napus TaxID=3708 RepID=A0ABQ7Z5W4_BRANA|nr:hypothetical protein HID58_072956 [Brassica napus]
MALIFTALSEAAAKVEYCSTGAIDKVPGCYDSLKLAAENDYRWVRNDCCKVVYSFPHHCLLPVMNRRHKDINFFKKISLIFTALSEAAAKVEYCSTGAIDKVPGCYDSLKLAAENDYRWVRNDCCKVVYSFPHHCLLPVMNRRHKDINFFKKICDNVYGPI